MNTDLVELVNQQQTTLSKMEVALDAIADGVVFVNQDSQVEWCNRAFEQLVQRSHSRIIGSQFSELLPLAQAGVPIIRDTYPDVKIREGEYQTTAYELINEGNPSLILQISGKCTGVAQDQIAIITICDLSAQKRTEISLAESELKFRTIVENANDIILISDLDGIVRYISPNLENIMGYTPSELKGQSFAPIVHPDDLSKTWAAFNQLATTRERLSGLENRGRHKNGSWKWFSSNLSAIPDTDGNLLFVSVSRDITEYKHTEAALKASEARLNAILNSAVASIQRARVYANRTWEYEYFSPGSELIYGYTAQEILADHNLIASRIHPEDWETVFLLIFDSIFAEFPREYEYRHLHPDGKWRWISLNITSVRDQAADCWLVTVIATDITDKKQAEIALAESEFKFRTIVENGGDVIGIVNLAGIIRYISPNVENLIGYTPREMEGQSFETFLYQDDVPQLWSAFQQITTTGEKILGIEYRVRHKDGFCLWQLSNLSGFRDINGEFIIVGVLRDITERKQAEAALKASEARLNAILNSAVACIQRVRISAEREWEYEYSSHGSELIYGYTAVEILADSYLLSARVHPQDWEAILPEIFDSVFAERSCEQEYRYLHPDGNWRWISVNFTSVHNQADNCWMTTIIAIDITKRKKAEIALAESESKFRTIVENANDVIGISNLEGIVRYISPNVVNFTGFTAAEMEGKFFALFIHPDDIPKLEQAFHQLATTGERISGLEYRAKHKAGDYIWQMTNLSCFIDGSGELLIIGVVRDITERKQTEEALKASEARLNAILNSTFACIQRSRIYPDRTWTFEYCSPGSELIYGYTTAEILADNYLLASRVHPEDWETVVPQIFESVFAEQPGEYEYRYLHPDGNWRWIRFSVNSVRNEIDNFWMATVIATDITDKKRTEIALAESEFKFRSIVENANDVLCIISQEGIVRYISPNIVNITGFPPAELEGKSFEPLVHPDDVPQIQEAFNQLLITGERISGIENRSQHKDGSWKYFSNNLSLFEDTNGELLIIGTSRDITERKQAEAFLAYRAKVERLLSSISRQFIDQDIDTAINFTLEAIANFIGCDCAFRTSKADRSYIFEYSDDMKQYHLAREWCAAGIPARSDDGRVGNLTMFPWVYQQMLNHQAIAISSLAEFPPEAIAERAIFQRQSIQSMLVVPMTHSDQVVGCLGVEVVRCSKTWTQDDISFLKLVGELIAIGCARHKAEAALLLAKEAAEAANRAKSTFLANMSHELRTPLNAILGFAQLMEREPTLTSRQQESLAIINRSGEHLLNLINDVLEMSKIEAGRIVLNPEPINLPRLLQNLQDMFEVRTQAKQLTLQFELASDLPQYVLTDEGKLRQVLINLLSNAVKFTEIGGIILRARIGSIEKTKSTSHTLYFEVEDTGKGIAPEEIGNLFQPFVQTTSGIQAREGTGLGLTISRQFVRLMGGDIHVSSILGQGSIFRFHIQVHLADPPAVEPILTHGRVLQLAPDQANYRILVVDDRPENRDLIAQLLDTVGFETRIASNGQEAIQQWQNWHPQLIWMDMRMPVMDGYQATRQIRALEAQGKQNSTEYHQPTIIIALTASAFEEQREQILAAGCDDFVRKPFREQVIFDKMAKYLGVGYIYAQDSQSQGNQILTSLGDQETLTADELAVMSGEWIAALYQAAIEVDAERIFQLIAQIPENHLALTEKLTQWVRGFCFDEIIELIESMSKS